MIKGNGYVYSFSVDPYCNVDRLPTTIDLRVSVAHLSESVRRRQKELTAHDCFDVYLDIQTSEELERWRKRALEAEEMFNNIRKLVCG